MSRSSRECGQELELGGGALVRVGWTGRSRTKGLGLFVDPRLDATVDPAWDAEREWFLPIHLGGDPLDLDVIGVWAMNHRGKESGPKLGRTLRALEAYSAILERGRSIVVGDFNDNGRWDTPRQTSFKDTVELLRSIGYVSLYHARTGESHGDESAASLYWYRHRDRPYLVDHAIRAGGLAAVRAVIRAWRSRPVARVERPRAARDRARYPRRTRRRWSYPRHHRRIRPLIPAWRDLPMTNDRDSSGGYLTGDESERLWDEEEEDAFVSAQVDYDDEGDDSYRVSKARSGQSGRALAVAAEIVAIDQAIDRVRV